MSHEILTPPVEGRNEVERKLFSLKALQ